MTTTHNPQPASHSCVCRRTSVGLALALVVAGSCTSLDGNVSTESDGGRPGDASVRAEGVNTQARLDLPVVRDSGTGRGSEADDVAATDASVTDARVDDLGDRRADAAGSAASCEPADEQCDDIDNDCDGMTDETLARTCGSAMGECRTGLERCDAGSWTGICEGEVAASEEVCDAQSKDEDCDGVPNEGCACSAADDLPACGNGTPPCVPGTLTCEDGHWSTTCYGAKGPIVEECDGVDSDCDGVVDNGVKNACGGCGPVPAETCNGRDDDCNGVVDNGAKNACGGCGPVPAETCNGKDDDCNGVVDNGVKNACGGCGAVPTEACNAKDDDCDGRVDENICPRTVSESRSISTGGSDARVTRQDSEVDSDDWTLVRIQTQTLSVSADRRSISFHLIWQTREGESDKTTSKTIITTDRTFTFTYASEIVGVLSQTSWPARDQWFSGENHSTNSYPNHGLLSNIRVRFDGSGSNDTQVQLLTATLKYDIQLLP